MATLLFATIAGCPAPPAPGTLPCRSNTDCPTQLPFCGSDMYCWSTPDPGHDAGLGDSGSDAAGPEHDAAIADAGSDAWSDDAATVDAATDDAATVDAATDDAGTDAGPPPRFALSFDGTGDEVALPMDLGTHNTTFTFEAWVRPTSSTPGSAEGEGGEVFEHAGGCTGDFTIEWSGNVERMPDRFRMWVYPTTGCGTQVSAESSFTSPLDVWHHVAGVYDAGAVRLYVDGMLAASATQTHPIAWTSTIGNWIGRDGRDARPTRGAFIGEIDEVRVSATARYSGTSFVPPTHLDPDADTVAAWLLDEGTGTATADSSGHGYGGTVVGATWTPSTR